MNYAVTAATGHFGQAAVKELNQLVGADRVVVIARNAEKAAQLFPANEVRVADYGDQAALEKALAASGIPAQAVAAVSTIDRKAYEPGLLELCQAHGWPLRAYTPDRLNRVEGTFTPSAFVARTVGVDNVCERAAVLGAAGGPLLLPKQAGDGVTLALARMAFGLDWKWNQ